MIRLRPGTVLRAGPARHGLQELVVDVEGTQERAIAYTHLVGEVDEDARVLLNTTAVDLGLGTGGAHIVVAAGPVDTRLHDGREMKLRYTPHQIAVSVVESSLGDTDSLDGMPVVLCPLHSAVAPAAVGIRSRNKNANVVYVATDAAALPLWLSAAVNELKEWQLVASTITTGQAVGGDHEAVTVFGALLAAKHLFGADVAIVGMGPGNLGAGTRWGSGALEVGTLINSVSILGGLPVVAPRISFADERERHQGISHHTITSLERIALARARVAVPPLRAERAELVRAQLAGAAAKHDIVEVALGEAEDALRASGVALSTMGRTYDDDPDYFRSAAAAGVLAASLLE